MKKNLNALCEENFVAVFYTYQKASEIKPLISKILSNYLEIVKDKFTIYSLNDAKIKKIGNKDIIKLLNSFVYNYNFDNSFCLQMSNDCLEKTHNIAFELNITDFPSNISLLPNIIYFEFPINIDIYDIYDFMKNICDIINVEYSCCNPIISHNALYYPKSVSTALNVVYKKKIYNTKESIYLNYTLLQNLINHKIGTINLIQILSSNFPLICYDNIDDIYFENFENYTVISALNLDGENDENNIENINDVSEECLLMRYKHIFFILKDIFTYNYTKNMFFKKDLWDNWIKRFE